VRERRDAAIATYSGVDGIITEQKVLLNHCRRDAPQIDASTAFGFLWISMII
jgi:hypothetical protein